MVNPYRYTGREFDAETGVYNYRARYYDSTAGRFVSEDPLRLEGGAPNFYSYAANSPTNFIDEFGEQIGVKGSYTLYLMTIMYLKTSSSAAALIQELESAPEVYMVNVSDSYQEDHVDPLTYSTIYWNPHQALCVNRGVQSPALQLLHEMVHVWQHRHHVTRFGKDAQGYESDLWEQPAVQRTNPAATQLGEPTRTDYYDAGYRPNAVPINAPRACDCSN